MMRIDPPTPHRLFFFFFFSTRLRGGVRDVHEAGERAEPPPRRPDPPGPPPSVVLADMAANLLGVHYCSELEAFTTAQAMLKGAPHALADEDKPMVERLLTNAAIRFARKLALLPPTEKA